MPRGWTGLAGALALVLWAGAPRAAAGGEEPHVLVEEGKRLFEEGQFAAAQEKFAAAEVGAPENRRIAYNRALAYQAAGDLDRAEEYYRTAALAPDPALGARIDFNLGNLEVARARGKLGEDPVAVAPAARPEILEHLTRAVDRFRSVLAAKPGDPDARYNIEVIRLFVKDLEDRWRKADRERARNEADLLDYLDLLIAQQTALERATGTLAGAGEEDRDRPVRLEETRLVQEELRDEMPHLRTKVKEHLAKAAQGAPPPGAPPGAAPPTAPDPAASEALAAAEKELLALVDSAEASMKTAVEKLQVLAFAEAAGAQREARKSLLTMWKGLADFSRLLGRAIRQQDALIGATEPRAEASAKEAGAEDDKSKSKDGAEDTETAKRLSGEQAEVRELVPLLTARARAALEKLRAEPAPAGGGQPPGAPGQPDPAELVRAFEKTLELLPQADGAMEGAVGALDRRTWPEALEKEKQAAKILKEIRDLFPKPPEQDQQKQGEKPPEPEPEQKKDEAKEGQKPPPDPQQLSPEEAERELQKMRENRKKREQQRREAEVGRRFQVEKDW